MCTQEAVATVTRTGRERERAGAGLCPSSRWSANCAANKVRLGRDLDKGHGTLIQLWGAPGQGCVLRPPPHPQFHRVMLGGPGIEAQSQGAG